MQKMGNDQSQYRLKQFFIFISVVTGALFAILISITPPGADDLLFLIPAKGHTPGPGLWNMMIGEIPRIWTTQSGRLGNFLSMPFLYLMPKWIFGILTGGLVTTLIIISCRITESHLGSIVSWLLYATIVLAFPWYDYMTLVTYSVNYVWASTAIVGAIYCFLHIRSFGKARMTGTYILLFVAGWMHEGFGAPLTVGISLCLLIRYKDLDRSRITAWICACAGTCMTFFSPTFWTRSERETNFLLKFTYKEALMQVGPAAIFITSLLVLIIILIMTRSEDIRKILTTTPMLIFEGATLASAAVILKFYTGPRTCAPVILYSSLGCAYILTQMYRKRATPSSFQWVAGILIGGFSTIHLMYADIYQHACTKEYEEVTHLYQASSDGIFYYDLTYPTTDISLFKTSVRQFHEKVPKEFMRMYFKPEYKMVILPSSMKGFTPEKAKKSIISPGAMIYNGWIVVPSSYDIDSIIRINIQTESGEFLPSRFRTDIFNCPEYGDFILITPHIKVLDPSIKIKDVAINDNSR